jgi:hypothetical protein
MAVDPNAPSIEQEVTNLAVERANSRQFFGQDPSSLALLPGWQRNFCGNTVLTQLKTDPNSPVWNVTTDGSIIPGHNEITGAVFVNFVRQLYHDTVIYPIIVQQMKK